MKAHILFCSCSRYTLVLFPRLTCAPPPPKLMGPEASPWLTPLSVGLFGHRKTCRFTLTHDHERRVLSGEATYTNFIVFDVTQLGLELLSTALTASILTILHHR